MKHYDSIELLGETWENVEIRFGEYGNGRLAMQFFDEDTSELILTATVNVPHEEIEDGFVFIPDYSEREGLLFDLTKAGIVEPTNRYVESGFVHIPEAKLLIPVE